MNKLPCKPTELLKIVDGMKVTHKDVAYFKNRIAFMFDLIDDEAIKIIKSTWKDAKPNKRGELW